MADKALEAARAAYEHHQDVAVDQQHSSVSTYIDALEDALQAMQAHAEKAERERDEAYNKGYSARDDVVSACRSRAEAAEARVKELEEALGFYADPKNYKGEFVPGGHTDRGTFEMAHHVNIVRKDAGDKARTALEGGSNG